MVASLAFYTKIADSISLRSGESTARIIGLLGSAGAGRHGNRQGRRVQRGNVYKTLKAAGLN
jgi:hypothetical protein